MIVNQGKLEFSKMRDLQQMKKDGMELSTPSNEVSKMWDALMFQTYGFFDAPELKGYQGTLAKISSLDPHCPILKIFTMDYGMKNFDSELKKLKCELKDQYIVGKILDRKWTQFEKTQIQALIYRLEGYDDLAVDVWTKQLAKYPLDLMSLKNAFPILILNGSATDLSTLAGYTATVLPKDNIYYPFIKAYEAFGLEEKGQLDLALSVAKKSLEICRWNSWATHTVAHVFDSQGKPQQGLNFMNGTRKDWTQGNMLACHNNWHVGLFHLENNDVKAALQVWDTEVMNHLNDQFSYFRMSDSVSLLMRIEMEQCSSNNAKRECDISSRWKDLFNIICHNIDLETSNNFYDAHLALAMMGCGKSDLLSKIHDRTKEWISKYENKVLEEWETDSVSNLYSSGTLQSNRFVVRSQILIPLLKALMFFKDSEYQSAVKMLYPIRKQLKYLGGSKAQNDVFHQLLATSLLMAGGSENKSILKLMLFERQEQRTVDNYSDRMQKKIIDLH